MGQTDNIAGSIDGERDSAAIDVLPASDEGPGPTVLDNLHAMPVTDEEIAVVEAFLGLQVAMILGDNKSNHIKAI